MFVYSFSSLTVFVDVPPLKGLNRFKHDRVTNLYINYCYEHATVTPTRNEGHILFEPIYIQLRLF